MMTAYLGTGCDVVLPQLVARSDQLDRFKTAATDAAAEYAHLLLVADPDVVIRRFRSRAADQGDEWTAYATQSWDAAGGDDAVRSWIVRLEDVDPNAVRVPSTNPDETYAALVVALGEGS